MKRIGWQPNSRLIHERVAGHILGDINGNGAELGGELHRGFGFGNAHSGSVFRDGRRQEPQLTDPETFSTKISEKSHGLFWQLSVRNAEKYGGGRSHVPTGLRGFSGKYQGS
jgi:hypothetical protein